MNVLYWEKVLETEIFILGEGARCNFHTYTSKEIIILKLLYKIQQFQYLEIQMEK